MVRWCGKQEEEEVEVLPIRLACRACSSARSAEVVSPLAPTCCAYAPIRGAPSGHTSCAHGASAGLETSMKTRRAPAACSALRQPSSRFWRLDSRESCECSARRSGRRSRLTYLPGMCAGLTE